MLWILLWPSYGIKYIYFLIFDTMMLWMVKQKVEIYLMNHIVV